MSLSAEAVVLVINADGQKDSRRGELREGGDVTSDLLCSEQLSSLDSLESPRIQIGGGAISP